VMRETEKQALIPISRPSSLFRDMNRRVEPEMLDELPASDPRAVRSRGTLAARQRLDGEHGIMVSAVALRFCRAALAEPLSSSVQATALFLSRVAAASGPIGTGLRRSVRPAACRNSETLRGS